MKAIRTKYYGATATKSAHIKASDGDGNYILFSGKLTENVSLNHLHAAAELCSKMNWNGQIAGGQYKDAWYWVFTENTEECHCRRCDRGLDSFMWCKECRHNSEYLCNNCCDTPSHKN